MTSALLFHPLSDVVVSADHGDALSSWSIDDGSLLSRFSNSRSSGGGSASSSGPGLWSQSWNAWWSQEAAGAAPLPGGPAPPHAALQGSPLQRSGSFMQVLRGDHGHRGSFSGASMPPPHPAAAAAVPSSRGLPPLPPPPTPQRHHAESSQSRVTSMSWLDEHDACHLLTLDAAGVARVWDGRSLMVCPNGGARLFAAYSNPPSLPSSAGVPPL